MSFRSCPADRPGARVVAALPVEGGCGDGAGGAGGAGGRGSGLVEYRRRAAGLSVAGEQDGEWRLWSDDEDLAADGAEVAGVPAVADQPAADAATGADAEAGAVPTLDDLADAAPEDASAAAPSPTPAPAPSAAAAPSSPAAASPADPGGADAGVVEGLVAPVEVSVAGLVSGLDADMLGRLPSGQAKATFDRVVEVGRQLDTLASKLAGMLETRAEAAAPPGGAGKARRKVREQLAESNRSTQGEAGRLARRGQQLLDNPTLDAAASAGQVGVRHQSTIAEILSHVPTHRRAPLEQALVAAALVEADPVAFTCQARRLLGEFDPEALRRDERRSHERRSLKVARRDDGGVSLNGLLYGVQAETFMTAHRALLTHDGEAERRSDEQRNADALADICTAALNSGVGQSNHGMRPHVLIVVEASALAAEAGLAELGVTGPITMATLRPLLRDCSFARVITGPDGVPIEVSEQVRTVPRGLWRALVVRDKGCRWPGCHAPVTICEVAHALEPFCAQGKLSVANAVLLCPRHHKRFDAGGWRITIDATNIDFTRDPTVPPVPARPSGSAGSSGTSRPSGRPPDRPPDPPPPEHPPGRPPDGSR